MEISTIEKHIILVSLNSISKEGEGKSRSERMVISNGTAEWRMI